MAGGICQFHLAIPVRDLEESRRFYRDALGAREGRSTENHIDFDFYGHHLVVHQAPPGHSFESFPSDFHGESVPIPHFGMNLDREDWRELAERIKASGHPFHDPPHIRLEGKPGEHATLFIVDPSGNALEFKAFRNHDEVFARVFDPRTQDLFGLEELAAEAASPAASGGRGGAR
jgi:extradiol dioxygenase family protein